jgi:hypothetical protein
MTKARDLANAGTALGAVTATELGYVDGVTSAIQTQLDAKIGSASAINPTVVDAKGDLIAATAADTVARLAVGANDTVLTAASGEATGLKWAAPAGGAGNMAQIATGTLSGSSVVISGLSSYTDILVVMYNVTNNTATGKINLRLNATSSNHDYYGFGNRVQDQVPIDLVAIGDTDFVLTAVNKLRANNENVFAVKLTNCKNAGFTDIDSIATYKTNPDEVKGYTHIKGIFTVSAAVTSITLRATGGTWSAGTYTVWGS